MMSADTVKHGGSFSNIWGCICANVYLVRINGVNQCWETQIFLHHAVPSGRLLTGPTLILQQHNDPKHAAKVIKIQHKEEWEVKDVMPWSPQSPDINILECVWDYMNTCRKPTSTEDLFGPTLQLSSFKNCVEKYLEELLLFWRQTGVTANIDMIYILDFSVVHWWK